MNRTNFHVSLFLDVKRFASLASKNPVFGIIGGKPKSVNYAQIGSSVLRYILDQPSAYCKNMHILDVALLLVTIILRKRMSLKEIE